MLQSTAYGMGGFTYSSFALASLSDFSLSLGSEIFMLRQEVFDRDGEFFSTIFADYLFQESGSIS
jgi:hypothetical protein